jgi:hypothetical protein
MWIDHFEIASAASIFRANPPARKYLFTLLNPNLLTRRTTNVSEPGNPARKFEEGKSWRI